MKNIRNINIIIKEMIHIRNPDELIQYFVVNKDLPMSTGKIAGQVGHATTIITLRDQDEDKFKQWKEIARKKVVLGGTEKDLIKLKELGFVAIVDNGLTEIPPNSLTVVGLPIMTRSEAKQYIGRLRLL